MGGKSKKKKKTFHIVLLACAIVFAALFLFEANSISAHRYAAREAEQYARSLRDKNGALEVKLSEMRSLYNLESLSADISLEKAGNISYIEVGGASPLVLGN